MGADLFQNTWPAIPCSEENGRGIACIGDSLLPWDAHGRTRMDEVQNGFGRHDTDFWGFQAHGVVGDYRDDG